jgi:hypothetical protein
MNAGFNTPSKKGPRPLPLPPGAAPSINPRAPGFDHLFYSPKARESPAKTVNIHKVDFEGMHGQKAEIGVWK